jgi:hypothetical protein
VSVLVTRGSVLNIFCFAAQAAQPRSARSVRVTGWKEIRHALRRGISDANPALKPEHYNKNKITDPTIDCNKYHFKSPSNQL